jgi:two-component system, OmpR family, sensor histidine kinase MprB
MTLRAKLVVALAVLAAAATIAIGFFSYTATANQLNAQVNQSLDGAASSAVLQLQRADPDFGSYASGSSLYHGNFGVPDPPLGQFINGQQPVAEASQQGLTLPVNRRDVQIAGKAGPFQGNRRDIRIYGEHYRVETVSVGGGRGAVQVALSLRANDNVLGSLRDRILLAALLVVAFAGGIGLLIARRVTKRLITLTNTAEVVAQTGRLDVEVPVEGSDEAGRLAVAFNEMLSALSRSKDDQQRLVQDAGHELRTPLTSLRTNMSVLRRHALTNDAREQVLDDLDSETRELTDLVNELVELATDRSRDEPAEDVVLADVAERVTARARRRSGREVTVDADRSVVVARRAAIERAMSNLVDNALKFQENGSAPVEIVVRDGTTTVLDRGPGVLPDDIPHLFDRFYRSMNARSRPGSGLGLSIVRDVAERHGGTVFARPRPGGGSEIGFTIPLVSENATSDPVASQPEADVADAASSDDLVDHGTTIESSPAVALAAESPVAPEVDPVSPGD